MAFVLVMNAYPFVDVQSPAVFAAKIIGTVVLVNACGYGFYRNRRASRTLARAAAAAEP
jgi:hypothetical protein